MAELRIFISSPGDVVPERRRAALVVEKLAKDYSRFFEIKPYLWETEPMLASGTFQDAILPPGESDILLLILWARLGTPLPESTPTQQYRGIDGRVPVTGTEWEFETALAAYKDRGAPDLLAYKKGAPPHAEYRSDADLDELRNQLRRLDAFWRRHFVDHGAFRAAFSEFDDLDGFEIKLENDLRRLIELRIAALQKGQGASALPTWLEGSPFRGLETYRFEHSAIFFGRSEATKTAIEYLLANAEAGRPFLLVLGASGAGKSSLAQAGIVPALGTRAVVPGVGAWRRAVVRPAGHAEGPFMALAAALSDEDALPELVKGQDVSALARHLGAAAVNPGFPIVAALSEREQVARKQGEMLSFEEMRLVIVVDQMEELFTLGSVTPDQRKAFVDCLNGLMGSGRVFVVATMRSDYWHRAAETPKLVALAEGHGRLDLLPPTQAEIAEMIRRPAEVAGISFEIDTRTEIRLDAALAEEASREPGALPLLSFLLDALYARDVQIDHSLTLRYATMRELGGLKGAIASRAEAAYAALPATDQAALPKVLRALVTVSRSGAEPTARPVAMAHFAEGSPERAVVDAFLVPQVRLLVADADNEGARVRLAHEALITHWERAKRQTLQDREDLRTRTVIEEAEAEWNKTEKRKKRDYLLRDPQLAVASDLARRWGGELSPRMMAFIEVSRSRARIRQRLTLTATAVFALVAMIAVFAAYQALQAQKIAQESATEALRAQNIAQQSAVEAQRAQGYAQERSAEAVEQRERALATQSKLLSEKAARLTEQDDTLNAIAVALEAFRSPDDKGPERYSAAAEKSLADALYRYPFQQVLRHESEPFIDAATNFDDSKVVAVAANGIATFWNRDDRGRFVRGASLPSSLGTVRWIIANPVRPILLVVRSDRTLAVFNYETGSILNIVDSNCNKLDGFDSVINRFDFYNKHEFFKFDPTGSRLAVFCSNLQIVDLLTNRLMTKKGPFDYSAMSGNGKRIVTVKREGKVFETWNAATGDRIKSWKDDDFANQVVAMSFDGDAVFSGHRYSVQIWNSATGIRMGKEINTGQARTDGIIASPFDDLFATSGDDGAHVWSAARQASIQNSENLIMMFLPGRIAVMKNGGVWRYVVEGHMGTSSPKKVTVLSSNVDQRVVGANSIGNTIISIGAGDIYVWKIDPPMLAASAETKGAYSLNLSGDRKTLVTSTYQEEEGGKTEIPLTLWDTDSLKEKYSLILKTGGKGANQKKYGKIQIQLDNTAHRLLVKNSISKSKTSKSDEESDETMVAYEVFELPGGKRLFPPADQAVLGADADMSLDGRTLVVGTNSYLDFFNVADGSKSKRCQIEGVDISTIRFNEDADRIAVDDQDNATWLVKLDTCEARKIMPPSEVEGSEFSFEYRMGFVTRSSWWRSEKQDESNWTRVRIWSEEKQDVVQDWTKREESKEVSVFSSNEAGSRKLLAETALAPGNWSDGFVRIYNLSTEDNLLHFQHSVSAESCGVDLFKVLVNPTRLLIVCRERGVSRLKSWKLFTSVDSVLRLARERIEACPSIAKRRELGLEDSPPRWCVEMGKSPYDTAEWKNWLAAKDAGDKLSLPVAR